MLSQEQHKLIQREVLLSFWKIHILHHAKKEAITGMWMLKELKHHGYDVSPGTLYPLLKRMEKMGWLISESDAKKGPKAPRFYTITPLGEDVLGVIKTQLNEIKGETTVKK